MILVSFCPFINLTSDSITDASRSLDRQKKKLDIGFCLEICLKTFPDRVFWVTKRERCHLKRVYHFCYPELYDPGIVAKNVKPS